MSKQPLITIANRIRKLTGLDVFISKGVGGWKLVLADGDARTMLSEAMAMDDLLKWMRVFVRGVQLGVSGFELCED